MNSHRIIQKRFTDIPRPIVTNVLLKFLKPGELNELLQVNKEFKHTISRSSGYVLTVLEWRISSPVWIVDHENFVNKKIAGLNTQIRTVENRIDLLQDPSTTLEAFKRIALTCLSIETPICAITSAAQCVDSCFNCNCNHPFSNANWTGIQTSLSELCGSDDGLCCLPCNPCADACIVADGVSVVSALAFPVTMGIKYWAIKKEERTLQKLNTELVEETKRSGTNILRNHITFLKSLNSKAAKTKDKQTITTVEEHKATDHREDTSAPCRPVYFYYD